MPIRAPASEALRIFVVLKITGGSFVTATCRDIVTVRGVFEACFSGWTTRVASAEDVASHETSASSRGRARCCWWWAGQLPLGDGLTMLGMAVDSLMFGCCCRWKRRAELRWREWY
jgi:hypothetical protein